MKRLARVALLCLLAAARTNAEAPEPKPFPLADQVNAAYAAVEVLYIELHRNPELGFHEQRTAATLAARLGPLGYEVATGVGGTGLVAVLRNGAGPTVMLRTELDALPVEEKTGLPYASTATTTDDSGAEVPVMHACGHDIHMAAWVGTAELMAANRERWHGTLMLIAQPAEEIGAGAAAMLRDGLFIRFPRPDFAFALHDDNALAAGQIGYHAGYFRAAADTVEITIFGRGGHGALPQDTVDPILIAARTVLALQTIVSRENDPREPVVVTVGTIHGGTKSNIIPDEVKLALTVRTFNPQTRARVLAAIERIAKAEAQAAGAPREPALTGALMAKALYNDPDLTSRVVTTLRTALGPTNVVEMPAQMTSEDFSEYALAGVPSVQLAVGAVDPAKLAAARRAGAPLPSLHSSQWAPERKPTLKTAITAEVAILLDLLGRR